MKTGSHPMKTRLRLFLDWGITFGDPYQMPEHGQRKVYYAGRQELDRLLQFLPSGVVHLPLDGRNWSRRSKTDFGPGRKGKKKATSLGRDGLEPKPAAPPAKRSRRFRRIIRW